MSTDKTRSTLFLVHTVMVAELPYKNKGWREVSYTPPSPDILLENKFSILDLQDFPVPSSELQSPPSGIQ